MVWPFRVISLFSSLLRFLAVFAGTLASKMILPSTPEIVTKVVPGLTASPTLTWILSTTPLNGVVGNMAASLTWAKASWSLAISWPINKDFSWTSRFFRVISLCKFESSAGGLSPAACNSVLLTACLN